MIYTLGLVVAGAMASCDNAAMERKMENLERRVAQLEGGGRTNTPVATQPVASATPEVPTGPAPAFQFEETDWDFGDIQEGTVAEHVFKFTNNGEAPLIISDAQGSCGCTVPQYSSEPIPVGGEGEITVKFNSQGRTGNQVKYVTLTANTNPSITRLSIRSNVEATAAMPAE